MKSGLFRVQTPVWIDPSGQGPDARHHPRSVLFLGIRSWKDAIAFLARVNEMEISPSPAFNLVVGLKQAQLTLEISHVGLYLDEFDLGLRELLLLGQPSASRVNGETTENEDSEKGSDRYRPVTPNGQRS